MSDARVKFARLGGDECERGGEQTFSFACPLHKGHCCEGLVIAGRTSLKRDPQGKNGGVAQWDWQNQENVHAPTFLPSVNCGCCWHGFIVDGRCVSVSRTDEPEPTTK